MPDGDEELVVGRMWTKVLVVVVALCQLAVARQVISVDYIENVRAAEATQGRIVSGWDAAPGQFPYQVALRATNQQMQILGCGGTAIHQGWILTAAHCTANYLSMTILAGLTNIHSAEHVSETFEWYNHPTYNANNPAFVQPNDISVIKLRTPLVFSANLQRIKIQPAADAFREYTNEKLIATGWGRLWTGGEMPDVLQWVYLVGLDHATCARAFGSTVVNSNAFCATWYNVSTQSICQGDSGGPVVEIGQNGHIQIGISSFVAGATSGGCHSGHPSGFVRPGPFHSWLTEVSGIDFDKLDEPEPTTTTTQAPITTSSVPSTTPEASTTTPQPPTTPEEESESSEESDESDEDGQVNKILKKLKISVKVKVNMKKIKTKDGKVKEIVQQIA